MSFLNGRKLASAVIVSAALWVPALPASAANPWDVLKSTVTGGGAAKADAAKAKGGQPEKAKGQGQGQGKSQGKSQSAGKSQGKGKAKGRGKNRYFSGPVALVEEIKNAPKAGVGFMDSVHANQVIPLGGKGMLALSYNEGCLVDRIRGGTVTVAGNEKTGGSLVAGGRLKANSPECETQYARIVADTSEAGATVKRLFGDLFSNEKSIGTNRPYFRLDANKPGLALVVVADADQKDAKLKEIWRRNTKKRFIQYPKNRNRFRVGYPYIVTVTYADGTVVSNAFSYDPGLELPKTYGARTVFLTE